MKSKGDSTLYQAIMSVQQSEPIKETRALDRLQQEAESLSPFAEYYDKLTLCPGASGGVCKGSGSDHWQASRCYLPLVRRRRWPLRSRWVADVR